MIIYQGTNPDLERIIRPFESKIGEALFEILGRKYFPRLDTAITQLLSPEAFQEPDTYSFEPADQRIEKYLAEYKNPIATFLIKGGNILAALNTTIADQLSVRIAQHAGTPVFLERNNSLFDSLDQLTNEQLVKYLVNWQQSIRTASDYVNNSIASLSDMKYVKQRSTFDDSGESVAFSAQNDFCFALGIDYDTLTRDALGTFSLPKSKTKPKITLRPQFVLPRTYGSYEGGVHIEDEEAFRLYSFIHEFCLFIQYALQPAPVQAVSTILIYEATIKKVERKK